MRPVLSMQSGPHAGNSVSLFKQPIKQPSVITRILCGAGYAVVPFSLAAPQKYEGMARQVAQPLFFCAALPLENAERLSARHPDKLAPSGVICGVFLPAPGRALRGPSSQACLVSAGFAIVSDGLSGRAAGRPQRPPSAKLLAGSPSVAAGRSPGAARVRALRGTPAGAASCSITKTPLDDALKRAGCTRNIII